MPILELRNLVDKDALMNSIAVGNARLESAIKELSDLGESKKDTGTFKRTLASRLKGILHGLQN